MTVDFETLAAFVDEIKQASWTQEITALRRKILMLKTSLSLCKDSRIIEVKEYEEELAQYEKDLAVAVEKRQYIIDLFVKSHILTK